MSFRLWMIFYAFAELAAAMALFGAPLGISVALAVLGFWAYCWKHGYPSFSFRAFALVFVILALLVALLLPEVQSAREAARRSQCMNNLKQIGIAIQNYADIHRTLPPAYVADVHGKPMHSWRVLVLPYMNEQALFNKYNFNEPWDGPNNKKLVNQMPEAFRCPSDEGLNDHASGETSYFLPIGPETAFPGSVGIPFTKVTDGTSHTMSIIEASGLHRNWMDPKDISLDEAIELLTTKPRSGHKVVTDGLFTTTYHETSFRNVAFLDCHVEYMGQLASADDARAALTCAGGDPNLDAAARLNASSQPFVEPKSTTVIKWGRIWGLSIFVILSLLPAAWLRQRAAEDPRVSPA